MSNGNSYRKLCNNNDITIITDSLFIDHLLWASNAQKAYVRKYIKSPKHNIDIDNIIIGIYQSL